MKSIWFLVLIAGSCFVAGNRNEDVASSDQPLHNIKSDQSNKPKYIARILQQLPQDPTSSAHKWEESDYNRDDPYYKRIEKRRKLIKDRKFERKLRREERRRQNKHGSSKDIKENGHVIINDRDWLAQNITSIWEVLNDIQRQMKHVRRTMNLRSRAITSTTRPTNTATRPASKDEDCNNDWIFPSGPNSCLKEEGAKECDGRGTCICGQCQCDANYYGSFCSCDDTSCDYHNGMICGGPSLGQCRCGRCVCRPEYYGAACECSMATNQCMNSVQGKLCSGNGDCACNRCHCNDGYSGMLCEESIYSASMCERLKPCVLCQAFNKTYPQCQDCTNTIEYVAELESTTTKCVMSKLGCIFMFSYHLPEIEGDNVAVSVQRDKTICLPNN